MQNVKPNFTFQRKLRKKRRLKKQMRRRKVILHEKTMKIGQRMEGNFLLKEKNDKLTKKQLLENTGQLKGLPSLRT
jgi:hypothetical protein